MESRKFWPLLLYPSPIELGLSLGLGLELGLSPGLVLVRGREETIANSSRGGTDSVSISNRPIRFVASGNWIGNWIFD